MPKLTTKYYEEINKTFEEPGKENFQPEIKMLIALKYIESKNGNKPAEIEEEQLDKTADMLNEGGFIDNTILKGANAEKMKEMAKNPVKLFADFREVCKTNNKVFKEPVKKEGKKENNEPEKKNVKKKSFNIADLFSRKKKAPESEPVEKSEVKPEKKGIFTIKKKRAKAEVLKAKPANAPKKAEDKKENVKEIKKSDKAAAEKKNEPEKNRKALKEKENEKSDKLRTQEKKDKKAAENKNKKEDEKDLSANSPKHTNVKPEPETKSKKKASSVEEFFKDYGNAENEIGDDELNELLEGDITIPADRTVQKKQSKKRSGLKVFSEKEDIKEKEDKKKEKKEKEKENERISLASSKSSVKSSKKQASIFDDDEDDLEDEVVFDREKPVKSKAKGREKEKDKKKSAAKSKTDKKENEKDFGFEIIDKEELDKSSTVSKKSAGRDKGNVKKSEAKPPVKSESKPANANKGGSKHAEGYSDADLYGNDYLSAESYVETIKSLDGYIRNIDKDTAEITVLQTCALMINARICESTGTKPSKAEFNRSVVDTLKSRAFKEMINDMGGTSIDALEKIQQSLLKDSGRELYGKLMNKHESIAKKESELQIKDNSKPESSLNKDKVL